MRPKTHYWLSTFCSQSSSDSRQGDTKTQNTQQLFDMGDNKRLKSEEGRMGQTLPLTNLHPPKIKPPPDTERIVDLERRLMDSERMVVELRRQGLTLPNLT